MFQILTFQPLQDKKFFSVLWKSSQTQKIIPSLDLMPVPCPAPCIILSFALVSRMLKKKSFGIQECTKTAHKRPWCQFPVSSALDLMSISHEVQISVRVRLTHKLALGQIHNFSASSYSAKTPNWLPEDLTAKHISAITPNSCKTSITLLKILDFGFR